MSGGTGSGKTILTRKLIKHHQTVFRNLPKNPKVVWCYGISQKIHRERIANADVEYTDGLMDEESIIMKRPQILVIDDLMTEKANDAHAHNLFTKLSHHLDMTVIYITQNLYERGQTGMKRNAHYIFMMRNPSDKSQITTLGRQLYPRRKSHLDHFYESYDDATRRKFGYLLIDVSPDSKESEKLKTNLFPDERGVIVYQPKT